MNNFTFYAPTLFAFGDGEEKNTGALVRRFGGTKVLLVYGGGSVKKNGAYDAVTASLNQAKRNILFFCLMLLLIPVCISCWIQSFGSGWYV